MDIITKKVNLLKALAQPTRLRISELLRNRERCVSDLLQLLNEEQANVSKHIAILRQAGIVEFRKEGVNAFYKIKGSSIVLLLELVDSIVKPRPKVGASLTLRGSAPQTPQYE